MTQLTLDYFYGVCANSVLAASHIILDNLFNTLSGEDIYRKNIQKLHIFPSTSGEVSDRRPKKSNAILRFLIEITFSWIGLYFMLWRLKEPWLKKLQKYISMHPEDLNRHQFPLRSEADLSPENVWARLMAIKLIIDPKESRLMIETSLFTTTDRVKDFDASDAIDYLEIFASSPLNDAMFKKMRLSHESSSLK